MLQREFYTAIVNGTMNEEVMAFAAEAIAKMDARNEARKAKPSKTAIENAPIKEAILTHLTEVGNAMTETDLGLALDITHNKAGALARQLVAEGKLTVEEVKIPKVGKRKAYKIVQSFGKKDAICVLSFLVELAVANPPGRNGNKIHYFFY